MICLECKSKFKFIDRLKSMNRRNGKIQCRNCKTTFIIKGNLGKIVNSIVISIIAFITTFIGISYLIRRDLENKVLGSLILGGLTGIIVVIYYFIAQNWWKYEKFNENSEK